MPILLSLEFGPDFLVLSCALHALLLTHLFRLQLPVLLCIMLLLCCNTTITVPFSLPPPKSCSSVSFLLFREAEASSSGIRTVLTKASSSSVYTLVGIRKCKYFSHC